MKIAIVGGGFFGCAAAIKIKEQHKKYKVTIFEEKKDILFSASGKNQFRCHRGYHYPRSQKTINECLESFDEFNKYFKDCYIDSQNYYAVSKEKSLTTFNQYLKILNKNQLNYKLEKRPKWPESGHTKTTLTFHKNVFNAPNLLGIFAGHIHQNSIEIIKGKTQVVADDNASGGYLDINFLPLEEQDKKLIIS